MATNERLAAEIPAGTGLNGHGKELSGRVLGKHRLFAVGSRNLLMTSWKDESASWANLLNRLLRVIDNGQ